MRMNGSAVIFFQIKEVPIFYYPLSSHNKPLSMNLVVYACLVSFDADSMGGQQMINPQGGGILNFIIIHLKYFSISDCLKAHA